MSGPRYVPREHNAAGERLTSLLSLGVALLLVGVVVTGLGYGNPVMVVIGALVIAVGQVLVLIGAVGIGVKLGTQAARFEDREER